MNKDVNPFKNGYKQPASVAVMALLVFGAVAAVMAISPRSAFAAVDISSSSTKFYGPALERVLITDTSKDTSTDTINPHIDVKRGSSIIGSADPSIGIIGTSGTFEFFLTTSDQPFAPAHPTQSSGLPYVVRISDTPSVNATHETAIDIGAQAPLKDGDTIVVTYGGQTKTIQFSKSNVVAGEDRGTAGNSNLITITLNDQDANIDPTAIDQVTATGSIITATGGTLNFTGAKFIENGQNSGAFDLVIKVGGTTNPANGARITGVTFPSSVSFTLSDFDVYSNTPASATAPYTAAIPNSAVTSSQSVTLRNNDGILSLSSVVSLANGINVSLNDPDRNVDTKTKDTFTGDVVFTLNATDGTPLGGGVYNAATFKETDFNSGIFVPDLTDNAVPISIVTGATTVNNSTGITINNSTLSGDPDLHIRYQDPAADPSGAKTFEIVTKITHTVGSISGQTAQVTPNGKFSLTITDNDLNTNSDSADSFIVTMSATNTNTAKVQLQSGLGAMTLKVKGAGIDLSGGALTMSFIETGPNTGIFTATNIDMAKINAAITGGLKDGDQVEFKYYDQSEDPVQTSTATLTVGKPPVSIDVDRSTVSIPTGGGVKFTVTVTDQALDINPSSTDTRSLGHNTPSGTNKLEVAITKKDGTQLGTTIGGLTGAVDNLTPTTFTETGASTGVFTHQFTISMGGSSNADLDNAKIKFTYTSASGTTTSISVTTKSFDGSITTSSTVVKNGDQITVTVSDPDLNLDAGTAEQTSATFKATNDDIAQGNNGVVTLSDLKETGPNTGVFTRTVTIGKDVKVADLTANNFATILETHYNDALASDLSTNVDRELDLRVGSTTGGVTTTPDVVGPGTTMYIMVADSDLNANPQGIDTTVQGQEYLRITSNATNANVLSTDITGEETGANTGVFKTKLTLSPRPVTGTPAGGMFQGAGKEITGKVLPGDILSIRYTDQSDASGNKVTVAKTVRVVSVDPEMKTDKDSIGAGDSFTVTIADTDANVDGDAVDTVTLRVTSTSDPVGITVTALETGPNTGVFTANIPTTSGVTTGSVSVKTGDNLSIKYNDKYPADYSARVKNVADPSKDFYLNLTVGGGILTPGATTPGQATPSDLSGQAITEVKANQQVLLTSMIHNNQDAPVNFVAIIEVFDANGQVVKIGISGGQLAANGDSPVGTDFTADASGSYKVKIFVLSDLANPTILATPSEMNLTVS